MFPQIKYADMCAVLLELVHFLAGGRIAFIVVFLTNNNFGHVCVPTKVSALFSVYRVVVSTVAFSMYVCMEHNAQYQSKVWTHLLIKFFFKCKTILSRL